MLGFRTFGLGPHKVIALHGWFGDQMTYVPMEEALTPTEFTYIFPAYRGYGSSRHLNGTYSMKEIAQDVLALADHLHFDTFSLVGHSMGGMAVQRVLADAPARVRKIVAVTPVPASGVPLDPATYELFDTAVSSAEARRGIVSFSVGGRLSPTWIARVADYPKQTATDEAFASYFRSWCRTKFADEIKGKTIPIKVIVGEHDAALTADLMRQTYLAWYPNAELEMMSNSGHYPMNETPIALATSIEAFLRK